MTTTEAQRVLSAKTAEDLFGEIDYDFNDWLEHAKSRFKKYARVLHPDKETGDEEAFKRLNELWVDANRGPAPNPIPRETIIVAKAHTFTVTPNGVRRRGDLADIIPVTFGVPERPGIVKIARSQKDRDLMQAEVAAIKAITEPDDVRRIFVPERVESFFIKIAGKSHAAIAYTWPHDGYTASDWWSIAELRKSLVNGVQPRDVAWIARRLFVALSLVADRDYVHGNITPKHVLVQPEQHGLMLVGWAGASKIGENARIISPDERYAYPPSFADDKTLMTEHDLAMACNTLHYALCEFYRDVPKLSNFLTRVSEMHRRGLRLDVHAVRGELDTVLLNTFGPPRFHAMEQPERRS